MNRKVGELINELEQAKQQIAKEIFDEIAKSFGFKDVVEITLYNSLEVKLREVYDKIQEIKSKFKVPNK